MLTLESFEEAAEIVKQAHTRCEELITRSVLFPMKRGGKA